MFSEQIRIRDPDRHQNVVVCSLAHCQPSLKISCKSVQKLLRKQTTITLSSLAEVINLLTYLVLAAKIYTLTTMPARCNSWSDDEVTCHSLVKLASFFSFFQRLFRQRVAGRPNGNVASRHAPAVRICLSPARLSRGMAGPDGLNSAASST